MQKDKSCISVGNLDLPKQVVLDLAKIGAELPVFLEEQKYCSLPSGLKGPWELIRFSHNTTTSYCGVLLKTTIDEKPVHVIWHFGTESLRDIPNGLSVALGRLPIQLKDALYFTRECEKEIADSDPSARILQSGHSLGGALAILSNYKNAPCLTFDAPGTRRIMEQMQEKGNRSLAACRETTVEIVSPHENLVNTQGQHAGKMIVAGEPYWTTTKKHNIKSFLEMTLASHKLTPLREALERTDDLSPQPAEDIDRSPTFLHAYLKFKYPPEQYQDILLEDGSLDKTKISSKERRLYGTLQRLEKVKGIETGVKIATLEILNMFLYPLRHTDSQNFTPTVKPSEQSEKGNSSRWQRLVKPFSRETENNTPPSGKWRHREDVRKATPRTTSPAL